MLAKLDETIGSTAALIDSNKESRKLGWLIVFTERLGKNKIVSSNRHLLAPESKPLLLFSAKYHLENKLAINIRISRLHGLDGE